MSRKQLALIHLAKQRLGIDEDLYKAVLFHHGGGVTSARDLTNAGFDGVMAYFTACGFRSTWTARTYGYRAGMASPAQVDLIRNLWREWSETGDDAALNHWLEKHYKASALRFLSAAAAGKAINGLRAMVARKRATGVRSGSRVGSPRTAETCSTALRHPGTQQPASSLFETPLILTSRAGGLNCLRHVPVRPPDDHRDRATGRLAGCPSLSFRSMRRPGRFTDGRRRAIGPEAAA